MGWVWKDEPSGSSSSSSSSRLGLWGNGDLDNPNPSSVVEERCSTSSMVRRSCRTEEVEPGRFVRKCDNTKEILRECIGRPAEIVESETEHTEEDVTNEMKTGSRPFELFGNDPSTFPGFRREIEAFGSEIGAFGREIEALVDRNMADGFNHFMQAAEEMTKNLFQSFRIQPREHMTSSPSIRRIPVDDHLEKNNSKPRNEPAYEDISEHIRDV